MYNNALFQYELGGELFMTSEDCMSNNSELNCWVEQRKNLECYILRSYIYGYKYDTLDCSRGHNGKLLPPTTTSISRANGDTDTIKKFSKLSQHIHCCDSERKVIEDEIAKILNNRYEMTFKIVAHVREKGVEDAYKNFKKGAQNTPPKKVLQRLKRLCNKFSEISGSYHYKITPDEKAILKRSLKK